MKCLFSFYPIDLIKYMLHVLLYIYRNINFLQNANVHAI